MPAMLDVRLFGDLELAWDGEFVALPRSRKACEVLAWLALHPGTHSRSRVTARVWPDAAQDSARANLRSALWALRAALGPASAALVSDRDGVGLVGCDFTVDVLEFDRLVSEGSVEEAARVCRGELLPLFDADWVVRLRDEYGRGLIEVLDTVAARSGDTEHARRARLARTDRGDDATTTPSSAAARRQADPLVGRSAELDRLTRCWRGAERGSGTVVQLCGDGGIGKSRLASELLARAEDAGGLVAVGAPQGIGAPQPFDVWLDPIRLLARTAGPLPEDAAWPGELARVVPELSGGRAAAAPDLDRARFFEAVVDLIRWACGQRPVALLIDDLHLAAPSSLELLAYVGKRIPRLPAVLVLTRRRLPPRPDVDHVCSALRAGGALGLDIDLEPLPASAVRLLVHAEAGLSGSQVEDVVAAAAGSPLVAVETARAVASGAGQAAGLRSAVRWAIGRLNGQARLFVEIAAVARRELSRTEVAAQLPLADPLRAAAEALGSGLLRERGGAIGFRHALLAEAVYDDMADPVRARMHAAFADGLRRGTGRGRAAEIAKHLCLAGQEHLATAHLAEAAAEARAVGALAEAADLLGQISGIEVDDPGPLVELAEVQAWRGLPAESDAAFDRAIDLMAADDTRALAAVWLRRGRWMRGGLCHPSESRRSYATALDLLDRDDDADPRARIDALAGMAWAESAVGDPAKVDGLLSQVSALTARTATDPLLTHDIGLARAHALLRAGRFGESYAPLIAAAAAANRAHRPDMAHTCLMNAACAAACMGDFDRALDFVDRCLPLVVPNGLLRLGVYAYSARSAVMTRLGRLGEAKACCDRAADLAERTGLTELEALVRHDRALIAAAAGEWSRAASEFDAAIASHAPVSLPLTRLRLAEALARDGRFAEARTQLRAAAVEPVSPHDYPDTLVARMAMVQGLIARHEGDLDLAAKRFREAATGWRHRVDRPADRGSRYVAALVDLGRPPMAALIEPTSELARVDAELSQLEVAHADIR